MTPKIINLLRAAVAGVLWISILPCILFAESASDPAGFYKLTFLGNSDTIVSLPFSRPPAASGMVDSVADNKVLARGTLNWISNQFVYASGLQSNTYYIRFESGTKEGRYYPITSNETNNLTLDLASDTLGGVAQRDLFSIVPYWTLGTVFPNGKGVIASTSTITHKTEVLIPNYTGTCINLTAAAIYYFLTNANTGAAAWRMVGPSSSSRNDDIVQPNVYLIVRHKVAANTVYTSIGSAVLTRITIPLKVNLTDKQDNILALTRPVPVSLDNSGLISSGAFTPSTSSISHKDELITFDNTTTNLNRSASAIYYYLNSAWRRAGIASTINVGTSNVFVPGAGFIIRKSTGTIFPLWSNNPSY